jgi:hypothetical protein
MAFVGPRSRVRQGAGFIRRADGPLPDVLFSAVSYGYRAPADRQHDVPFSRAGLYLFHPPGEASLPFEKFSASLQKRFGKRIA